MQIELVGMGADLVNGWWAMQVFILPLIFGAEYAALPAP